MALQLIAPGERIKRIKGRDYPNRFWLIRGTVNGRPVEVSTKTTDKKAADDLRAQLDAELRRSDAGERADATLGEAIELYLNWRDPSKGDRVHLEKLKAVLGARPLATLKHHHLVHAADTIYPKATNATKNRHVFGPAAAVLHYAAANDLCGWMKVRKLKEPKPVPRAVDKTVFAALRAATEGEKRLLIVFIFRQGWRISDALRLNWKDVDLKRATAQQRIGKTDDWRTTALHRDVLTLMRRQKSRFGRVFPWATRSGVYKWLRPLCKRLRVEFTPHRARHSFATWLVNAGAEMADLMEAGNWRDPKSVMRYGKPSQERVRSLINKVR